MSWRVGLVLGAVVLVALAGSHWFAYRQGRQAQKEAFVPTTTMLDEAYDFYRLFYAMRAMRIVARAPSSLPREDLDRLCADVRGYVKILEERRIPALREAGDDKNLQKHLKLTSEAKQLIRQLGR